MSSTHTTKRFLTLLSAFALTVVSTSASAQDSAVVQRLVEQGQMSRDTARGVVRGVNGIMAANAQRGGDAYDDLRQKVNRSLFGASAGPGQGRAEYEQRLGQVLARMRAGLDLPTLQVLFAGGRNSSVRCAHQWGITMGECDGLIAAATLTPVALPYLAPDDGRQLQSTLRSARVRSRLAREIATKLRAAMLGVPRSLANNADGRIRLQLLAECPGGANQREAQIRAWHIGPTEGMAQCIAVGLARRGGPATAVRLFDMSERAATAFVEWGVESSGAQIQAANTVVAPPVRTPPRRTGPQRTPQVVQMTDVQALRNQGAAFARAGRMPNALTAYQAAVQQDPTDAPTLAALGAVQLALGDRAGAVASYEASVANDETNANVLVGFGRALAASGQNDRAIAALQQAMRLDYDNQDARMGLRALGGEAPLPPLPETPSRDAILSTMQPLQGAVQGCAPQFAGRVAFRITVVGATGEVLEISSEGEMSEDEKYCMESVVQSARFPRFTNENLNVTYPFVLSP